MISTGRQSYSHGQQRPDPDYSAAEDYELHGDGLGDIGSKPDAAELRRRRAKWFRECAITGIFVLLW